MTATPAATPSNPPARPSAKRLQQEDAQQIGGVRADGLQNRQHVHALLEMRVHGHGDADGAEDHGDEADEAQDRGGIVEAAGERRIAFAKVHHLRVGQRRFKLLAHCGSLSVGGEAAGRSCGKLDEQAARGAAAGSEQSCAGERSLRDHDARTHANAGADAIGLLLERRGDAKVLAAQAESVADVGVEADEKFVGDDCRVALERLAVAASAARDRRFRSRDMRPGRRP